MNARAYQLTGNHPEGYMFDSRHGLRVGLDTQHVPSDTATNRANLWFRCMLRTRRTVSGIDELVRQFSGLRIVFFS